jgi:hypothetical protein
MDNKWCFLRGNQQSIHGMLLPCTENANPIPCSTIGRSCSLELDRRDVPVIVSKTVSLQRDLKI